MAEIKRLDSFNNSFSNPEIAGTLKATGETANLIVKIEKAGQLSDYQGDQIYSPAGLAPTLAAQAGNNSGGSCLISDVSGVANGIPIVNSPTEKTSEKDLIGTTSQLSLIPTSEEFQTTIYALADFLVKVSVLLASEEDSKILEAHYSLKSAGFYGLKDLGFYYSRMSKDSSPMMKGVLLKPLSERWMNWGMTCSGKCLTARISESRRIGNESSLSGILETSPDPKYFLSEKSVQNMVKRMEKSSELQNFQWHSPVGGEGGAEEASAIDANYSKGIDGKRTVISDSGSGRELREQDFSSSLRVGGDTQWIIEESTGEILDKIEPKHIPIETYKPRFAFTTTKFRDQQIVFGNDIDEPRASLILAYLESNNIVQLEKDDKTIFLDVEAFSRTRFECKSQCTGKAWGNCCTGSAVKHGWVNSDIMFAETLFPNILNEVRHESFLYYKKHTTFYTPSLKKPAVINGKCFFLATNDTGLDVCRIKMVDPLHPLVCNLFPVEVISLNEKTRFITCVDSFNPIAFTRFGKAKKMFSQPCLSEASDFAYEHEKAWLTFLMSPYLYERGLAFIKQRRLNNGNT